MLISTMSGLSTEDISYEARTTPAESTKDGFSGHFLEETHMEGSDFDSKEDQMSDGEQGIEEEDDQEGMREEEVPDEDEEMGSRVGCGKDNPTSMRPDPINNSALQKMETLHPRQLWLKSEPGLVAPKSKIPIAPEGWINGDGYYHPLSPSSY